MVSQKLKLNLNFAAIFKMNLALSFFMITSHSIIDYMADGKLHPQADVQRRLHTSPGTMQPDRPCFLLKTKSPVF